MVYTAAMANYVSDVAIVLRVTDFSETSQIVVMLTREHGVVPMIAKGSKRASKKGVVSGPLDLLTAGEVVFVPAKQTAELGTLAEWELTDHRKVLRGNLAALNAALVAAEVTLLLQHPHDPHPELFDECEAAFELLGTEQRARGLVAYVKSALISAGYGPQLEACVVCGKELGLAGWEGGGGGGAEVKFNARAGGIICGECVQTGPTMLVPAKIVMALARLPGPQELLASPPERAGDMGALRKAMALLLAQVTGVTDRVLRTAYVVPSVFV